MHLQSDVSQEDALVRLKYVWLARLLRSDVDGRHSCQQDRDFAPIIIMYNHNTFVISFPDSLRTWNKSRIADFLSDYKIEMQILYEPIITYMYIHSRVLYNYYSYILASQNQWKWEALVWILPELRVYLTTSCLCRYIHVQYMYYMLVGAVAIILNDAWMSASSSRNVAHVSLVHKRKPQVIR